MESVCLHIHIDTSRGMRDNALVQKIILNSYLLNSVLGASACRDNKGLVSILFISFTFFILVSILIMIPFFFRCYLYIYFSFSVTRTQSLDSVFDEEHNDELISTGSQYSWRIQRPWYFGLSRTRSLESIFSKEHYRLTWTRHPSFDKALDTYQN